LDKIRHKKRGRASQLFLIRITNHRRKFFSVTFPTPISAVASATCAGNAATASISGNQVSVNCTGVPNAQTITINLTGVNDGTNVGNVIVPMGVLLGDVNASRIVTSGDTNLRKAQALQPVTNANFRNDINASGAITTGDVNIIKQNALSHLPP